MSARRRVGAGVVGMVLACAPSAPGVRAAGCGPGDTGVVSVSSDTGFSEGEEPLAANALDPLELTAAANVFQPALLNPFIGGGGVQDTRVYSSRDGGCTWTTKKLDQGGLGPLSLPFPPGTASELSDAFNILNTDADTVWDDHGRPYFESGDVHGVYHRGNEVETVWRSVDGGVGWGPRYGYTAVNATQEHTELDRPWLAVDNSGGPHDGRLFTTYETTPFADIPPEVFARYSDDHGATWSPSARVDDGIYETQWNPRARPAVGADGALYVVYDRAPITDTPFASYARPIQLVLARSSDGRDFSHSAIDDAVLRVSSPSEATPDYTEMISAIATDPVRAGHVAVAWPQAAGASSSRILLRYSFDGGAHWSARVDVADDPASVGDQHDHVTLAWLPDGRLFMGWRDRRCCGGSWGSEYQQWVRVLEPVDRGRFELGRVVQFTDGMQAPNPPDSNPLQPDEFQGLVATPLGVGLTWSQLGPDGLDHLMFRRVPLSAFG